MVFPNVMHYRLKSRNLWEIADADMSIADASRTRFGFGPGMTQMDQQDSRQSRYLAMLSHDLRSALSGVIGGLTRIDASKLDDTSNDHRESALASAIDVSRLLDGIVDMEAIEKNEFVLDELETDLDELLVRLQRRWSGRASSKGISFSVEKSIPLPRVITIDSNRLFRALGNVVENAIKYTDDGTVSVHVAARSPDGIAFSVRDNGPGFSDAAMDRLFEYHGRPDDSQKIGSGLGLHIAKTLISQMNGDIMVARHDDGGAEVTVIVPAAADGELDDQMDAPATVAVLPTAELPDLSHLTILLAEDNLTNQLVVTQMLAAMKADYVVASNGVEALDLFESREFDMALLDIEMPRMSGLDVIRAIRARRDDRSSIPIVALTAYAMREHRERIAAVGADGLIAKPIMGIEDFGNAILKYCGAPPAPAVAAVREVTLDEGLIDRSIYDPLAQTLGKETMNELLAKVAQDLTGIRDNLNDALATGSGETFRAASHVLISVAGAIGAVTTQRAAENLNKAAHQSDRSKIRLYADGCLTNIDLLLKFTESNGND